MSTQQTTMGQQSKATIAWLKNFVKHVNPHNATIEEVPDDEDMDFEDGDYLEHGFFFLDEEPTSEEDPDLDGFDTDEEVDKDMLEGLENEADIAHFNAVLAQSINDITWAIEFTPNNIMLKSTKS